MRIDSSYLPKILPLVVLFSIEAFATETSIKVKDTLTEDTSIVVKKGAKASEAPDFEIIVGDEAVYGDPILGQNEAYANWKSACNEWKKEVKELNKTNQLLMINCNQPTSTREKTGLMIYRSRGTYKIRVPIRKSAPPSSDALNQPESSPSPH